MKRRRRVWLAAFLFLSFLSSLLPHSSTAQEQSVSHRKFVIYYGWYGDGSGKLGGDIYRIIQSAPDFVISPYYNSAGRINLTPEVMQLYHQSGIKVLVYIATGNSQRNLDDVLSEIKTGLQAGADGVMLDEVSGLSSQGEIDYYQKIYNFVKDSGGDNKIVVANPGSILVSEKIMNMTDILSFEHQWRLAPQLDWFSKYPASRFMGVSSNDVANVMGYEVDGSVASRDTIEAWQTGIGYHYSTDSYTNLPRWFESYQGAIQAYSKSIQNLQRLDVKTKSEDGSDLKGLWIEVRSNGALISTGFSPAHFNLPQGSYQVWASNYESLQFSRWDDGDSSALHEVTLSSNQSLTAIYKSKSASLDVDSIDTLGNHVRGMSVNIIHNGNAVATGYTPLHLTLPVGEYTIQALSYRFYQFSSWSDGNSGWSRDIGLNSDASLTATYSNSLIGKVGTAVFSDGCYDPQKEEKVAESLIAGGPLQAAMQTYSYQTTLLASCGG